MKKLLRSCLCRLEVLLCKYSKMIFIGLVILLITTKSFGDLCETCLKNAGCVWKTLPERTMCSSKCDAGNQWKFEIACCPTADCFNLHHCTKWENWWRDFRRNNDHMAQLFINIFNRNRNVCTGSSFWALFPYEVKCGSNPCQNNGTCSSSGDQYTCNCAGTGFYGVDCETNECKPIPTDIVFVLDSSTSMTNKEFNKQLQFVSTFIDHIKIGPDDFRVSAVTFSSETKVEFGFDDYLDNDTLKSGIEQIKFRRGVTFTHLGLASVEALFKNEYMSNNSSLSRKKYVCVLTDGMSTDRKKTAAAAVSLKKIVHKVITIGIGYEVSHKELLTISSPPDYVNSAYVFSVDDFNSLNTILKELVQLTCDKCDTSSFSDVVFLIDSSFYITDTEYQIAISSITYIIENMKGIDKAKGINVCIVIYDTHNSNIVLPLNNSMVKLDILQRLTRIEAACEKDDCCIEPMNETMSVLYDVFSNFRKGSRRFLVMLSNGKFKNLEHSLGNLVALISRMYHVNHYLIGLGENVNMEGLQSLVNDPNHVFITPDDSVFKHLDVLQAAFTYNECDLH